MRVAPDTSRSDEPATRRQFASWSFLINLCISLCARERRDNSPFRLFPFTFVVFQGLSTVIFQGSQPANIGAELHEPRKPRAQKTVNGDKFSMVLALAAGSLGLTFFAQHVARLNQTRDSDTLSSSARVIRVSVIQLWLPATFVELAERRIMQPSIRTHEEMRQVLEVEGKRDAWYALTVREHHEGGRYNDLTYIRCPYDDPRNFREYPEVLAVAAGKPSGDPRIDFSSVSVCVVPEQSPGRTPRAVICEALGTGLQ
jgi:hypothetical protein